MPIPELLDREVPVEIWTDGACSHPGHPTLRRAGWGLWVPGCPDACASEPLRGSCQSAQRAELRAFVAALERTDGHVRIWTDSRFVTRGAAYLDRGVLPPLQHADLWRRAHAVWRRGSTQAQWVKAHLDWPSAQRRGIRWQTWAGNQRADELARLGAHCHAPAAADIRRVLALTEDVRRAQKWMTAALGLAADAGPADVATRRARRGHSGRVLLRRPRPLGLAGEHGEIVTVAGRWQCVVCRRHVRKSRGWRQWRQLPCRPARRSCPKEGAAMPDGDVPPGRTAHLFATAGGRTRCLRCGQSRVTRWRSKLGVLCPAAAAPAEFGLQLAELPMPAPAPVARQRRVRGDVDATLASHLIALADGWLQCGRPGCRRRCRPRERSRFAWCTGEGAPDRPPAMD